MRYLVVGAGSGVAGALDELDVGLPVLLELRVGQTVSFEEELRVKLQLLVRHRPLRITLQELELLL